MRQVCVRCMFDVTSGERQYIFLTALTHHLPPGNAVSLPNYSWHGHVSQGIQGV
eukprot:gene8137-7495_t